MIKIVKIYSKIHHLFHHLFSINLPGLGFLFRQIKHDFIFEIRGKQMLFNHKIADNYGRLLNGDFNEPETHIFLDRVFNNKALNNFHFVDIGANIGEFVLDYSDHLNVGKLTVFEPQPEQIKVIENTLLLNKFSKTELIRKPVSDSPVEILFNFNYTNSTASGITSDSKLGTLITATTIDEVFAGYLNQNLVFLIDTEGAELNILKGGHEVIKANQPLIIFEYNHVTKNHFQISDVQNELGDEYKILKLSHNGKLVDKLENIWNLVALPKNKFDYLLK